MEKLSSPRENTTAQAHAARQSAIFVMVAATAVFFIYLYLVFTTPPAWQLFAAVAICLGVDLAGAIAFWLVPKGRYVVGMRILIGAVLLIPAFFAFIFGNSIASVIEMIAFVINLLFAVRTLPPKDLPRVANMGLIAVGVVTWIDMLAPATQLSLPAAESTTMIAGAFIVVMSIIFIAREFKNLLLASKLLLTFLAITIVPFLALGFLLLQVTGQNLTDAAGKNLKTLSNSQAIQVGRVFASEEESLRLLATNPVVDEQLKRIDQPSANDLSSIQAALKQQESSWENLPDQAPQVQQILNHPMTRELKNYLKTHTNNLDVLITDQYGAVVAATRRPLHYYVADQAWWQKTLDEGEEDIYIGQPMREHPGDPLGIFFAIPITATDTEEIIGVLRANYSMHTFSEILKQETVGTQTGAEILLPEGQVYRTTGDIVTFDTVTAANLKSIASAAYGQFIYDGVPSLVSQSLVTTDDPDLAPAVNQLGWHIVHGVDSAAALKSLQLVTKIGIFAGLAVLLLIMMIALWLSNRISLPIVQLTRTAQKIADGDLNAQTTITSKDEIGVLGSTFNEMTTQLKETLKEVSQQTVALQSSTKSLSRQTLQLRAATDVSRALSSVLNVDELMQQIVDRVHYSFHLYYVGLFIVDETGRFAILKADSGEAQMLAVGYQLEINGETLTGQSILRQEAVISQNIQSNNPLLPQTRSELALPLISLGQVIGAIIFKSEQESAFGGEDVNILQTMVDQLANGIEKARLYDQIQQRAVELTKARESAENAKDDAEKARAAAEEANRSLAAQMWQTTGLAELNDKMRGEQSIDTLAPNVIQHLCKYLEIYSGAIYILEDNTLQLQGTYARIQKSFAQQYQIGEELVGQAALEKGTILHQVPDDYIKLSLSQEKVLPKFRLIAPIIYNQQVSGVIAFEAMTEFTQAQKGFIEEAIENVAITFMTAQARARVNELFSQTRRQAEELQAQEEELRSTNEELEAQTDSLRTSEARLRTNQTALETANAELEENSFALQAKQTALDEQNRVLRNAQQELERKAEELTISNKYKSEFLANMSHELRTPLNSLLILSKILTKNERGNLTPDQVESAQIIYGSGSDLLQLINDILDLSKVEAGQMTFHYAPMSLTDFAQNMRLQFEHVAKQKGLEFEIKLIPELPESIITDHQRVEQVIKNLLANAIKFTNQGIIQLSIEPAEEMIAIHVSDNGIGMTPEQQQRVFEAFQQADGSTSRKYGGTGLGLTISREMTAKLGGRIGLKSELGTGSVFTLYLPLTPPEAAIASPRETAPVPPAVIHPETEPTSIPSPVNSLKDDRNNIQKGDRVLLVIEDDTHFAKVLLNYAHKKNFKCVLAQDGENGLKLATQQPPDAILLDLKLPGMSGWDVLDTLKDNAGLRHIPVHILSAADHSIDAYKRGALGFLSKPISQDQLENVFSSIGEFISRDIKSLLIVEDDNGLRSSVGQLLGGNDVQISEAASGQVAIQLLREAHFDCIILDLTLPDMSGFELLNKISHDEKILKCPVIVYTGQALTEDENEELLKYASSVIIKGVKSPERLLDETALFLHRVVADMPAEKQNTIRLLHDHDSVFSGKHILIVDDNMRNAFALSSLLINKNLKVTVARSGMKGLEMLDNIPDIDLVLMDIMMPEMDGYETMKRVRAQPKFKNLPILALTAKAMKGDLEKCIAAGANDYLSKPVDQDRLFSMLRVWLYR